MRDNDFFEGNMTKYPNGIDDNTNIPPVTPDSIGPLIGPPGPQGPPGPRGIPGPGGGGAGVNVQNHGTFIPNNPHSSINFTGTGVTTTDVGGVATVTITGGGGGGGFTPGGDLTGNSTNQVVSFIRGIASPDPAIAAPGDVFTVAPQTILWAGAAGIVFDGRYLWVSDGSFSGSENPPADPRVYFIRVIDPTTDIPTLIDSVDISAFGPFQNVRQLRMSEDNTKIYACIKGWDGSTMPSGGSQFSAPDGNGDQIITDVGGNFFDALVGATITVTGANTGDNGTFVIKSFISNTQITIHNPGGTLDTDTSSYTTNAIPGHVLVIDKTTRTVVGNAVMKNGIIGSDARVATGARACLENAGTLWVTNSNQFQGNIVEKFNLATVLANGTSPTSSFDFFNVDQHAEELCFLSGFIWTGGASFTTDISRIDPSDNSISTFTCLPTTSGGQFPFISPIALFGALWAGDFGENIMRFDPAQFPNPGFRTDVLDLGGAALSTDAQSQFLSDGTFLWHANLGSSNGPNCFYKIDPTAGAVALISTVNYPGDGVQEIVFDGTYIWGTQRFTGLNNVNSQIVKIDPAAGLFKLNYAGPLNGLIYDLPAVIIDAPGGSTTRPNIRSTKDNQAPIDNTKLGITCFSTDTTNSGYGAFGNYVTISGGDQNYIGNDYTVISGGQGNLAYGSHSVISGGQNNQAQAPISTVCGGQGNIVQNSLSIIAGGQFNGINGGFGAYCGIFGGFLNAVNAQGNACTIIGGQSNTISTGGSNDNSTIIGGAQNVVSASANTSIIAGGAFHTVNGVESAILGGAQNTTNGQYSAVIGGSNNQSNGQWSTVIGGQNNQSGGQWSSVIGGDGNNVAGNACVTIGGFSLTATGSGVAQILAGGQNNTITSPSGQNGILAGQSNSIVSNAVNSVIGGGQNNTISSANAFVHGFGANAFRSGQYGHGSPAGTHSSTQTSQYARMVLAGTSTNGAATQLLLSTTGGDEITLENHQYYSGRVTVIAARNDAAGGPATFIHTFVAHQTGGTAVLDLDTIVTSFTNGTAWTFTLTVTSNILRLTFTGTSGQTVKALATVEWTELPAF